MLQRSGVSALDKWLCFALEKLESKCHVSVSHGNRLLLSKGQRFCHWVLLCGYQAELFPHSERQYFGFFILVKGERQCQSIGVSVGWTWFPSLLQQERAPCQEARMSPGDVLLLLPARLIQPGSFKVCGNELQSHHSCGGFSEEIAEGSQRLWKSPFRRCAVAFHSRQTE